MTDKNKISEEVAGKVAEKTYKVSDYKSEDETDKGLANTHEQVSDAYVEGTIDGEIDEVDGEGNLISHKSEDMNSEHKEKV